MSLESCVNSSHSVCVRCLERFCEFLRSTKPDHSKTSKAISPCINISFTILFSRRLSQKHLVGIKLVLSPFANLVKSRKMLRLWNLIWLRHDVGRFYRAQLPEFCVVWSAAVVFWMRRRKCACLVGLVMDCAAQLPCSWAAFNISFSLSHWHS